ncbi:MAG: hypothetical protein HYV09_38240 [Deltaproteobacteria bacterium]|nr:hypothetical protein [Deltaproteobacteria bacterium]
MKLAEWAVDMAFPKARRWWADRVADLRFHRYDFELRDVTFASEVHDEFLRNIGAAFAPGRCTIDGRPLRVPRRPFRFSDPVFLQEAWRVALVLGVGVISYARHGTTLFLHVGIVLSALMLCAAVRETMYAPR